MKIEIIILLFFVCDCIRVTVYFPLIYNYSGIHIKMLFLEDFLETSSSIKMVRTNMKCIYCTFCKFHIQVIHSGKLDINDHIMTHKHKKI